MKSALHLQRKKSLVKWKPVHRSILVSAVRRPVVRALKVFEWPTNR